jgi:transcription-repair coupling factor (superfamily II helicase)
MIILDSDKFGLSQLYQLRGRVGRSNRMAYAYLMYQKDKSITEAAEKRLKAIREFTEFGSGFKVAMKDLEIRGAGNLLGPQQHGHMMMVGYELYSRLIDDAVRALGGEIVNPDKEESSVELSVSAFIPDNYITDEVQRLQMYKKIALVVSEEGEADVIEELMDRFGPIPAETMDLIKISRIRSAATNAGVQKIHERSGKIVFDFFKNDSLSAKVLSGLYLKYGDGMFIHSGSNLFVELAHSEAKGKVSETAGFLESIHNFSI